ncbi:MAG: hypothetical protein AAGD10_17745 [Myxococcota bacterium]
MTPTEAEDIRRHLQAAAGSARRVFEVLQQVQAFVREAPEDNKPRLLAELIVLQESLQNGLNHAGLMIAYAQGAPARTAFFARTKDTLKNAAASWRLQDIIPVMAATASMVAESLEGVAELDPFGPIEGAPSKPGPVQTARYARAHLDSLLVNLTERANRAFQRKISSKAKPS